jgi:hypothetical protein
VWQLKELQVEFSDVWQLKGLRVEKVEVVEKRVVEVVVFSVRCESLGCVASKGLSGSGEHVEKTEAGHTPGGICNLLETKELAK